MPSALVLNSSNYGPRNHLTTSGDVFTGLRWDGFGFPRETVEIRDTAEPAAWHRTAPKTKTSFAQEPVETALKNTY